jgi:hypothetical protein
MAKQSKAQKETVSRVMHEFQHGELETGTGKTVKSRRQAIAIGLSEAGASNQQSPSENKKRERQTRQKERTGQTARQQKEGDGPSKAELYERARKKNVEGRSKMSKAELARAVGA